MAEVTDSFAAPPLAEDRPLDPLVYYDEPSDTLIVSFYGPPEPGMNVPVGDESIDLRVSLDEQVLLGFEVPNFVYAFLPAHPEFLDFAATAGVPPDEIGSIRARVSITDRQRSAVDGLLRQFLGRSLSPTRP
jgi:hypothetical protein